MFWTRRRLMAAALAVIGSAVVATSGQWAFTNSNSIPTTTTAGYGSAEVTGGTVSSLQYMLNGTGDRIQSSTMSVDGDIRGLNVEAGFDSDALSPCFVLGFNGTSTKVACDGYNHVTSEALSYHVLIVTGGSTAGGGGPGAGGPGGGGGGTVGPPACDDFTGTDGASMDGRALSCGAGTWTAQHGTWNISNNAAVGTGGDAMWITMAYGNTDAKAKVTVSGLNANCGSGLALNSNDGISTLAVTLQSGNILKVSRVVFDSPTSAPTITPIAEQTIAVAASNRLVVTRNNGTLSIVVNDYAATDVALDSTELSSGNFGLYSCSQYTQFDNFAIASPTST